MSVSLEELVEQVKDLELPDYLVAGREEHKENSILTRPAAIMTFPLSQEDKESVGILVRKFDQEINCSGLAAPQIGISKRIIIFVVNEDPVLRKWRPDLTQTMPKTLWLNPSWQPESEEMHEDFEACFSVEEVAAMVKRYTHISYRAYDIDGNLITGNAEGFLARVLQHEIDHLDGRLFTIHVPPENLMNIEDYRRKRKEAMELLEEKG